MAHGLPRHARGVAAALLAFANSMSIRPISRIGSATTSALRGTSGVGGAERMAQIVADYSASSARMASVGSAGINGANTSTSTTGAQR